MSYQYIINNEVVTLENPIPQITGMEKVGDKHWFIKTDDNRIAIEELGQDGPIEQVDLSNDDAYRLYLLLHEHFIHTK